MGKNLRATAVAVLLCFGVEQVSFAVPGGMASRAQVSVGQAQGAGLGLLGLSKDIARVSPVHAGVSDPENSQKLIYLIEDAHTNASGQKNASLVLNALLEKRGIEYVFTEAAIAENSLSYLKAFNTSSERKRIGLKYLMKGLLKAAEYTSMTSEHDFKLWGVENKDLYWQSLHAYRVILKNNSSIQKYLSRIDTTLQYLKPKIYNAALLQFSQQQDAYKRNALSITDYIRFLISKAESLDPYKHLQSLSEMMALELTDEFKNIKDANDEKYTDHLKRMEGVNTEGVLIEMRQLEDELLNSLAVNDEEVELATTALAMNRLQQLFRMKATSHDFRSIQENKTAHDIFRITAFMNGLIHNREWDYERVIEIEDEYASWYVKALRFYELTQERDHEFVKNIMREDFGDEAALIVGGYHTEHLKHLLKEAGVSVVVITPQVEHETNMGRYQKMLMDQLAPNSGLEPNPVLHQANALMTLHGARMGFGQPSDDFMDLLNEVGGHAKEAFLDWTKSYVVAVSTREDVARSIDLYRRKAELDIRALTDELKVLLKRQQSISAANLAALLTELDDNLAEIRALNLGNDLLTANQEIRQEIARRLYDVNAEIVIRKHGRTLGTLFIFVLTGSKDLLVALMTTFVAAIIAYFQFKSADEKQNANLHEKAELRFEARFMRFIANAAENYLPDESGSGGPRMAVQTNASHGEEEDYERFVSLLGVVSAEFDAQKKSVADGGGGEARLVNASDDALLEVEQASSIADFRERALFAQPTLEKKDVAISLGKHVLISHALGNASRMGKVAVSKPSEISDGDMRKMVFRLLGYRKDLDNQRFLSQASLTKKLEITIEMLKHNWIKLYSMIFEVAGIEPFTILTKEELGLKVNVELYAKGETVKVDERQDSEDRLKLVRNYYYKFFPEWLIASYVLSQHKENVVEVDYYGMLEDLGRKDDANARVRLLKYLPLAQHILDSSPDDLIEEYRELDTLDSSRNIPDIEPIEANKLQEFQVKSDAVKAYVDVSKQYFGPLLRLMDGMSIKPLHFLNRLTQDMEHVIEVIQQNFHDMDALGYRLMHPKSSSKKRDQALARKLVQDNLQNMKLAKQIRQFIQKLNTFIAAANIATQEDRRMTLEKFQLYEIFFQYRLHQYALQSEQDRMIASNIMLDYLDYEEFDFTRIPGHIFSELHVSLREMSGEKSVMEEVKRLTKSFGDLHKQTVKLRDDWLKEDEKRSDKLAAQKAKKDSDFRKLQQTSGPYDLRFNLSASSKVEENLDKQAKDDKKTNGNGPKVEAGGSKVGEKVIEKVVKKKVVKKSVIKTTTKKPPRMSMPRDVLFKRFLVIYNHLFDSDHFKKTVLYVEDLNSLIGSAGFNVTPEGIGLVALSLNKSFKSMLGSGLGQDMEVKFSMSDELYKTLQKSLKDVNADYREPIRYLMKHRYIAHEFEGMSEEITIVRGLGQRTYRREMKERHELDKINGKPVAYIAVKDLSSPEGIFLAGNVLMRLMAAKIIGNIDVLDNGSINVADEVEQDIIDFFHGFTGESIEMTDLGNFRLGVLDDFYPGRAQKFAIPLVRFTDQVITQKLLSRMTTQTSA